MTKQMLLRAHGAPEAFEVHETELAPPGPGMLHIKQSAIGLNFIDIYQRKGLYPVSLPAVLGSEGVGTVTSIGEGVDGFSVGDRIAHLAHGGVYAEAANIPAALATKVPDAVSDDMAAAVFLKGMTAQMLVRQVFPLTSNHTCLVYAAAGGVGTLLCQWAAHLGARIIAVVGDERKAELAKSYGAAEAIVRTKVQSIAAEVRRMTDQHGVEVAYDSVGEATFETSLDSLAMRGHMVTYGNASGPVPAVSPLELSRRGSLTLTRPTLFHYATPERLPAMANEVFDLVTRGVLQPKPDTIFDLEKAGDAHRLLESGKSVGAIILKP